MTVLELINKLQNFDKKAEIKIAYELHGAIDVEYVTQVKRDGEETYVVFVSKD